MKQTTLKFGKARHDMHMGADCYALHATEYRADGRVDTQHRVYVVTRADGSRIEAVGYWSGCPLTMRRITNLDRAIDVSELTALITATIRGPII